MKDFETYEKATEGKSIEDFVQKIKELPIYSIYEKAVRDKEKADTAKLLQMSVILIGMADKELSMLITSLSIKLLFAMVDARLRNEILNESEDNHAD